MVGKGDLSLEQALWIIDRFLDRKLNYYESHGKEFKLFGRAALSLIEGKNHSVVSSQFIQIKLGQADLSFFVVPAGHMGAQWGCFAQLLTITIEGGSLNCRQETSPRILANPHWNGNHIEKNNSSNIKIG